MADSCAYLCLIPDISDMHSNRLSGKQVNLFKKGLGVGVPGNQHDNTFAQGKIKNQGEFWFWRY